ncbi:hypothetical protein [Skermanella pratensis]|uniref:hypothetical protein n=1 Tax=Skermanella pratensis TaxID=2233999 RepID=UPI00130189B8|nr:hypothetical protein [Skermanella pratensis]
MKSQRLPGPAPSETLPRGEVLLRNEVAAKLDRMTDKQGTVDFLETIRFLETDPRKLRATCYEADGTSSVFSIRLGNIKAILMKKFTDASESQNPKLTYYVIDVEESSKPAESIAGYVKRYLDPIRNPAKQ